MAAQYVEMLEERILLALDFGDAPDTGARTGSGNYNTLLADNGPSHTIVVGLFLGATVDGDDGTLQNTAANADDVDGALPDDEEGLNNPAADLNFTVGTAPTINVIVTNNTGSAAMLYGWELELLDQSASQSDTPHRNRAESDVTGALPPARPTSHFIVDLPRESLMFLK